MASEVMNEYGQQDNCTCIQDESRDWINCPVHGEKIHRDQEHNKKIADQIAKLAYEREQWADEHNWPLVGGAITSYITMWQCPHCCVPTLLPEQHFEWHLRFDTC